MLIKAEMNELTKLDLGGKVGHDHGGNTEKPQVVEELQNVVKQPCSGQETAPIRLLKVQRGQDLSLQPSDFDHTLKIQKSIVRSRSGTEALLHLLACLLIERQEIARGDREQAFSLLTNVLKRCFVGDAIFVQRVIEIDQCCRGSHSEFLRTIDLLGHDGLLYCADGLRNLRKDDEL